MNKRKILGILVTLFGLIMMGGSASSGYGLAAPASMSIIVLIGLAMIFWDKVSSWMK